MATDWKGIEEIGKEGMRTGQGGWEGGGEKAVGLGNCNENGGWWSVGRVPPGLGEGTDWAGAFLAEGTRWRGSVCVCV